MRPLAQEVSAALADLRVHDPTALSSAWVPALELLCTRRPLVAVLGAGVGTGMPDGAAATTTVASYLSQALSHYGTSASRESDSLEAPSVKAQSAKAQPVDAGSVKAASPLTVSASALGVECVPGGDLPGGAPALWRVSTSLLLSPVERVAEWPDAVVQVGVDPIAPAQFPVPVLRAPVQWEDPRSALDQVVPELTEALMNEAPLRLALRAAAGTGWLSSVWEELL